MSFLVAIAGGVGLLLVVTALARPVRAGRPLHARSVGFLSRYRVGEDRSPVAAVVVGAVAAATVADLGAAALVAPLLGAGIALLRRPEWVLEVVGACGAVLLFVDVLGDPCGGLLRVGTAVLAVAGFAVGYGAGRLLGGGGRFLGGGAGPGLALFGVLDLARFAASPLGATWTGEPASSVVLVVVAVGLVGVLAGIAPRLSLVLVAVGVAYVETVGPSLLGSGDCGSTGGRVGVIAAFTAAYLVVRAVCRGRRRRARS